MTTKNSSLVANFEATPQVANETYQLSGRKRIAQGTLEMATTDLDAADIVMLAPIPTNASISSIQLASDDLDSNGTPTLAFDIGVHTTAGVVVDVNSYATAITLGQAVTVFTEYSFEVRNIALCGQRMWQDAGATSDPGGLYYLSLTVSTVAATAAAGTLSYIVEYVLD